MNLTQLRLVLADLGCTRLYAKPLAENDNSKNQVYFGGSFNVLNILPIDEIFPDSQNSNPIFKARIKYFWINEEHMVDRAPHAQIILYPQYPEVRFSGFLRDCRIAPSELMSGRIHGRTLFLGVTDDKRVIGYVAGPDSIISNEFADLNTTPMIGVFHEIAIKHDSRTSLLAELRRIHEKGWIDSKQLDSHGNIRDCNAQQCGGFTLEAELSIPKNSSSEPDYMGWEVKQYGVPRLEKINSGRITLMTPEPNGGVYKELGPADFVRKYGYPDKRGLPDRLNFGGVHRTEILNETTKLKIRIIGYDNAQCKITDEKGMIALLSPEEEIAASWNFQGLMLHWTRKHSRAVYVPSVMHKLPKRQYMYGNMIKLAIETDFIKFLKGVADGFVFYDPGIKLEDESSKKPHLKTRSQFRIEIRNINSLYKAVENVVL